MKRKPAKGKAKDAALAAYYDSQSEEELVHEIESKRWGPARLKVKRTRTLTTCLRLAPETMHRVKALAVEKGIDYQTLLRLWIEERARKEARVS